jgi:L-erythro-3,5-diaminohexanoate dehydrogenase
MPTFLSPYGQHRVMEPLGALPQAAWKVDNLTPVLSNEILIDVDMLNIDSASFTQIKAVTQGLLQKVKACGVAHPDGSSHIQNAQDLDL